MTLATVILAAGKGTRMKSALPKVLHPIAGKAMVSHVLDAARSLAPQSITLVYGHGGEHVREVLGGESLNWALQAEQLGTGHAVAQAMPFVSEDIVLILYGDVPLIQPATLRDFVARADTNTIALMTLTMENPTGYGRIIRDANGRVSRIVEQKDANDAELAVEEVNTGILACPRAFLADVLPELKSNNAQGEYYLTDVISMAVQAGLLIDTMQPAHGWEVDGVNDRVQLARLERIYQGVQAENLMRAGVTVVDPARLDVRGAVQCGTDITLDINTVLIGQVHLGDRVSIAPNCVIRNASIAADSVIEANSVIDGATIGAGCHVGPFARLRPGTQLADHARVGNFVETKNAHIGEGSKANHLTYLGDAEIGAHSNIGAGTITCNYDGVNKSKTLIGDHAFIGSNSSLVAPVSVGSGATVGAGSVVTTDVPDDQLAVSRAKQRNIAGWKRPQKKD
ncbi:bifunctional UDP-N-acetylglucosamine diphosphorylase/glucosamine-1-phosphate N-acetyltransferase GlmU [Alcanivorax sp. 1008]|uniref:bifunctional UDP-N-acetylglucosamine diphosphorylase/glucosamine-1-phosphate N-acetyltransferase GlmU n=1 Tax=Alcanivorax sp. 1008 TaxID=2816853 RepID=UPI001D87FA65|nr:bifunctional UDP-N-acetylglucosamine diphosphorylase/glucosamine-1-phosphate N-acetyltransferase GlmU [Alcanivorax sp. 1008]MCC1496124.1 bifunctional UDP-N-acetylglucosamine diphosphorylase/glucosamine-1-phosphate N-acetyltransferase GlmU [Alcanivorax sp. 1008]